MINNTEYDSEYEQYFKKWLEGIEDEVSWWEQSVFKSDGSHHEYIIDRFIKNTKFSLENDLDGLGRDVRFIDIGSGPFSRCGFDCDKVNLTTIAVDPLAPVYNRLKRKYSMENPINLQMGFVELLSQQFEENSFDLVHMSNSLDHSFDPVFGIYQMLYICRIGGKVILRHHENEAENEAYEGMHQWNLSVYNEENSFVIWRGDRRFNIGDLISKYADMYIYPSLVEKERGWKYNKVVLIKKSPIQIPENHYMLKIFSSVYEFLLKKTLLETKLFSERMRIKINYLSEPIEGYKKLADEKGIRKVDIYGFGKIGRALYALMDLAQIDVGYIIDQRDIEIENIKTTNIRNYNYSGVDFIIVTVKSEFDVIRKMLSEIGAPEEKIVCIDDYLNMYEEIL
ncbi:MAG: hypothetical protein IJ661_04560 [Lachnospiraceae bacterium]|nr:hypothetical protein [Lachnospiraceae bacterium]